MRISGTNRFVQMQNIRGNEDLLDLPTNKSSRKKTFLYAALAAAGLGAAVLAYKAGIFSADPEVPFPIPNLFSPIPSFKDFDQNGTLLPGQSVVSLGQAFSPPTPPDDNGFCSFANNDYDPSQKPFTFESDTIETRSAFPELFMIDKVDHVPFLDPRNLLSKGNTGSSQINDIIHTSLLSPLSSETSQTNFLTPSEMIQSHGAFTYLIAPPPVITKTSKLSQIISISPAIDHSNILAQRNIFPLGDLSPVSEQPANVFTNSLFPGNAFIISNSNTFNSKPFTEETVTPALDFSSIEANDLNSDEHALVLQTNHENKEDTIAILTDSAAEGKVFSFVLPAPFNMSQPIINGTVTPAPDFYSAVVNEATSNEHAIALQTSQNDKAETGETPEDPKNTEAKAFILVVPGFNTSQPVINGTHTPPSNFCPAGNEYTAPIEN